MALEARLLAQYENLQFSIRERSLFVRVIQMADKERTFDLYDLATRIGELTLSASQGEGGGLWSLNLADGSSEMSGVHEGDVMEATLVPALIITGLAGQLFETAV